MSYDATHRALDDLAVRGLIEPCPGRRSGTWLRLSPRGLAHTGHGLAAPVIATIDALDDHPDPPVHERLG